MYINDILQFNQICDECGMLEGCIMKPIDHWPLQQLYNSCDEVVAHLLNIESKIWYSFDYI